MWKRIAVSLAWPVEAAAFLPAAPSGLGRLSLPSVSPHQQSSQQGQVLPPDAAFTVKPPGSKDCQSSQGLSKGERKPELSDLNFKAKRHTDVKIIIL